MALSNLSMENNKEKTIVRNGWITAGVIISRIVAGGTFIFSGFVKAIDPMGTIYKLEDYFSAFGLNSISMLIPLIAFVLIAFEFLFGVHALLGSYRKRTPWYLLLFMLVMTPLTLYLAVANPVSDCGCFGDAVVLTNWQTFWKNIVLLVFVVFLLCYNTRVRGLYNMSVQWLTGLFSLLFIFSVMWVGYNHQPILDFRPYKIGLNLSGAVSHATGEDMEYLFVYEKDGVKKEFGIDDIPVDDSTWVFVERHEKISDKETIRSQYPVIDNFVIYDGNEDVTNDILGDENYVFLLLSPDLSTADDSEINKINELYDYSREYGYSFYCLTSSSPNEIAEWKENAGAEYPFFFMDKTIIRTIARGNPCLLILKKGVIYAKLSPRMMPDESELTAGFDKLVYGNLQGYDEQKRIIFMAGLYFAPMIFLLLTEKTVGVILDALRERRRRRVTQRKKTSNPGM